MQQTAKLVLCAAVVVALASAASAADKVKFSIDGSTTVGPLADAFAEAFMKDNPNLDISVSKTGSGNGVTSLIEGKCDLAMTSRFLKPEEFKKAVEKGVFPVVHTICMDGVCIVLHPSNPIKALTRDQIRKIYKGEIKNWKELGGPDKAIIPISRESSSGTYEVFEEKVMKKEKLAEGVQGAQSNPHMQTKVSETEGAIGYVGLGFVNEKVKAVTVDGVLPTRKTIASGSYPISRPLFWLTNGYPQVGSLAFQFVTFALTERGQDIILVKDLIPLTSY